ncbi:MAG TPA: thiamine-phosphate kinase [Candidatus Nanoarchaeia archaeon]|nr:thiamine-phosphate kinase [Candidatus Nanoarchaeia archaeon]
MKLSNLGEFGIIKKIREKTYSSKEVIAGIGDDAAVLEFNKKQFLLYTTDALVENVHFSLKYFKPWQIGAKSIEQNASDIAAMGGVPTYAVVSLMLPENLDTKFVDELYSGINKTAKKYHISIIGGNISKSKEVIMSISMLGIVEKKYIALRKGAKKGDYILCSGNVGKSAAGLELLKKNKKGASIKNHLEPKCRLGLARKLVKIGINSMIDVSDGIASEITHICNESGVGAIVYADKIPISKNTINDAKLLGKNSLDFALYGGEDFELLFTAPKSKIKKLTKLGASVIGEIADKKNGIKLIKNNKEIKLRKGFEHF